ncbi:putative phospholipid:diacylglycerol acyltransferase 2 [Forsythia ovata]|uniref:Phospholipid:diacylglycerol acyltransferase 2 n=1 Tax=Forsythia ovata TaxID=205694 RepID=A0ABD1UDK7_9LAMI
MAYILRFRKLCFLEPVKYSSCDKAKADEKKSVEAPKVENEEQGAVSAVPEPPGAKLKREGLTAFHPVVLVPVIVTGGLELWEGKPCYEDLFHRRFWGGSFTEIFKRPMCWLEHLSLDNETRLDPPGIRVQPVPGLVAVDYFAPGYFVWAILIENLARIG